jgi:hypothetical protein
MTAAVVAFSLLEAKNTAGALTAIKRDIMDCWRPAQCSVITSHQCEAFTSYLSLKTSRFTDNRDFYSRLPASLLATEVCAND